MKGQPRQTAAARVRRVFALRLRELREKRGLSQVALSARLAQAGFKLDGLAILRIEKNADDPDSGRKIGLDEAVLIAKALGVRLDEMLREPKTLQQQLNAERSRLQLLSHSLDEMFATLSHLQEQRDAAAKRVDDLTKAQEGERALQQREMETELEALEGEIVFTDQELRQTSQLIRAARNDAEKGELRYRESNLESHRARLVAEQEMLTDRLRGDLKSTWSPQVGEAQAHRVITGSLQNETKVVSRDKPGELSARLIQKLRTLGLPLPAEISGMVPDRGPNRELSFTAHWEYRTLYDKAWATVRDMERASTAAHRRGLGEILEKLVGDARMLLEQIILLCDAGRNEA